LPLPFRLPRRYPLQAATHPFAGPRPGVLSGLVRRMKRTYRPPCRLVGVERTPLMASEADIV
jgi:hypothetical protein